jgi:hypothetical protein
VLGVVFVIEAADWTRDSVSVAELKSYGRTVLAVRPSQRRGWARLEGQVRVELLASALPLAVTMTAYHLNCAIKRLARFECILYLRAPGPSGRMKFQDSSPELRSDYISAEYSADISV